MQSKYSEGACVNSLSLWLCLRSEGSDKPGQHMLYELHCPGSDTHAAAEGLLPVRQTQV